LVKASVKDSVLHLELLGWSKWLAISGSLDIPLHCIKRASAGAPGLPEFRWTDLRTGGTSVFPAKAGAQGGNGSRPSAGVTEFFG
jgi:hypothetical protein